jgi:hypothetical protein
MRASIVLGFCAVTALLGSGCAHQQVAVISGDDVALTAEKKFQIDLSASKVFLQGVSDLRTGIAEWPGLEDPEFETLIERFAVGRRLHSTSGMPPSSARGIAWMTERRAFCRAYNLRLKHYLEGMADKDGEPGGRPNAA